MLDISPILSLIVFAIFVLIVIGIFFPKVGLFARYRRISRNTRKVQLEDALKHLYDYRAKQFAFHA